MSKNRSIQSPDQNTGVSESGTSIHLPLLPLWSIMLVGAVAVLLAYGRTLQFDFVWDDQLLLVEWPFYRSPELFSEAIWRNVPFSVNYFRPVAASTFVMNYVLRGLDPSAYHAFSVLLHILTTLVFSWLAFGVLRRTISHPETGSGASFQPNGYSWLALFLTLLFAWHPVHVEAVSFVSARFDLLSALFVLLALAFALFIRSRWLAAAAAGVSFLLALGAKEMAVTTPLLFFAVGRAYDGESSAMQHLRKRAYTYVAFAIAMAVYLAARVASLGYLLQPSEAALPAGNLLQHLLLVSLSAMRYVLLLVWPFGTLSPLQFASLPVPTDSVIAWLALVVGLVLLVGIGWGLWRGKRWAWLWTAFLISLLPVLNIVPLDLRGGAIIAERFLYLPSAFFLLALGVTIYPLIERVVDWALAAPLTWKPVVLAAALLPLIVFLATTLRTTAFWQDDGSLWQWARQTAPRSSLPPTNLAFAALDRGDASDALQWATLATQLDPDNSTAHNNVGAALMLLQQPGKAAMAFQTAAEKRPENPRYWENLAFALAQSGQPGRAIQVLEDELLPRAPESGKAYQLLGELYLQLGEPELALQALRAAESRLSDSALVRDEIAVALAASGRGAELVEYLDQGGGVSVEAWTRFGDMLLQVGDVQHALIAFQRAEQLAPESPTISLALAKVYAQLGMVNEAIDYFNRTTELAPGLAEAQYRWGELLWEQGDKDAASIHFRNYLMLAPFGELADEARSFIEQSP